MLSKYWNGHLWPLGRVSFQGPMSLHMTIQEENCQARDCPSSQTFQTAWTGHQQGLTRQTKDSTSGRIKFGLLDGASRGLDHKHIPPLTTALCHSRHPAITIRYEQPRRSRFHSLNTGPSCDQFGAATVFVLDDCLQKERLNRILRVWDNNQA